MRVVLVSKAYVLAAYHRKAEEIAALGVDLTLVVPPYWRDERGTMPLEPGEARGYRRVVLPIALNGHYHLHWNRGLARLLGEVRPDIVHIEEEPYNLATFLATAAAGSVGAAPVFFTWQNLNRRYPLPFHLMECYCHRKAAHAIAGTQDAAAVLRAKGYRGPTAVIPQVGVDPQSFSPAEQQPAENRAADFPRDGFVVGYVGRLMPEKGVDLLLQALAGLTAPWSLLVLGSGPEKEKLRRLADELAIAERVEFLPPVPSCQLPDHLRRLSCLVLPSRSLPNWREQFGRVLVEAMACGVPVIGSTCGEIPNVIGDAGLTFSEGNVEGLRQALCQLQQEPGLRTRLAGAGRQRVLEQFTQAQVAQATVTVYERVLAGARAGRRRSAQ